MNPSLSPRQPDCAAGREPTSRQPPTPDGIEYHFEFPGDRSYDYAFSLDTETFEIRVQGDLEKPDWTRLAHHQCSHCPLVAESHCPVAVNIWNVVFPMGSVLSHKEVVCRVTTNKRSFVTTTSAQEALRSMVMLVTAASACPHTHFFKPLTKFHLPFASLEEAVLQTVSIYYIFQYFRKQDGLIFDNELGHLRTIFVDVDMICRHMADRIRSAPVTGDAAINAIVILHSFALLIPLQVDSRLEEVRAAFDPYLHRP